MTLPAPIVLALRAALADALHDEFDRIADYLTDGLRHRIEKAADEPDADDVDSVLDAYTPTDFAQDLQQPAVLTPLAHAYQHGGGTVESTLGIVWGLKHRAAIEYARNRASELVGMRREPDGRLVPNPSAKWAITPTTRDDLKRLVVNLMETEGVSWRDLKSAIQKAPEFDSLFGEYRAEMVSRTEVALAVNTGEVGAYRAGGIQRVKVLDNAECPICGPFANTTQTVEWAAENSLGHPHCRRSWAPLVEGAA